MNSKPSLDLTRYSNEAVLVTCTHQIEQYFPTSVRRKNRSVMSETTVLIIDDNQDLQILVKFVLEHDTNWKVLTALSGEEGIALAQSYQPDAILLDVAMPELDGFDVYRSLKFHSSTRSIPIIFMTAIIGMEKKIAQRTAKDIKVISKPFNVLTLESQIIDTCNTQSHGFNTQLST